jgi:hypothetical protein
MDTSWCLRLERLQDWCIRPYYPSYSHSGIALSSATGMTRSRGGMAILTSGGARCCQGKREDSNTTTTGFTVWRLRTCRPGSTAAGLLADSAMRGLSISFWTSSRVASLDALFLFLRSITIIMPRPMVRGTVNSDQVSRLEMNSFGIVAVAGFRQICVTELAAAGLPKGTGGLAARESAKRCSAFIPAKRY